MAGAIIDKRKEGDKVEYLVQWEGQFKSTWEPEDIIKDDCPALIERFELHN